MKNEKRQTFPLFKVLTDCPFLFLGTIKNNCKIFKKPHDQMCVRGLHTMILMS